MTQQRAWLEELIARQAETYSNALVAFAVLQNLAFAFTFGTSKQFNCVIKTAPWLAESLVAMFIIVGSMSLAAILYLGHQVVRLAEDKALCKVVARFYLAKGLVTVFFFVMPVILVLVYAVAYNPKSDKLCASPEVIRGPGIGRTAPSRLACRSPDTGALERLTLGAICDSSSSRWR